MRNTIAPASAIHARLSQLTSTRHAGLECRCCAITYVYVTYSRVSCISDSSSSSASIPSWPARDSVLLSGMARLSCLLSILSRSRDSVPTYGKSPFVASSTNANSVKRATSYCVACRSHARAVSIGSPPRETSAWSSFSKQTEGLFSLFWTEQ